MRDERELLRVAYQAHVPAPPVALRKPIWTACMVVWVAIAGVEQRAYFLIEELQREPEHVECFWWDAEWEAASHIGRRREHDSLKRRMQRCIMHALRRDDVR